MAHRSSHSSYWWWSISDLSGTICPLSILLSVTSCLLFFPANDECYHEMLISYRRRLLSNKWDDDLQLTCCPQSEALMSQRSGQRHTLTAGLPSQATWSILITWPDFVLTVWDFLRYCFHHRYFSSFRIGILFYTLLADLKCPLLSWLNIWFTESRHTTEAVGDI